jgi:hypothetical protein
MNSKSQARFYLEQNHISFNEYDRSDKQYQLAVQEVRQQLVGKRKVEFLERDLLPTYQFGEHDLVVTLGQDGLVINTAKYLTNQPVLALNPDPEHIDGVLIPFTYTEARLWVERTLQGQVAIKPISMACAELNDGQKLYAVNDLFIGLRTHGSARYLIAQYFGQFTGEPPSPARLALGWDSDCLWFSVREPFLSKTSSANLVFGQLRSDEKLLITSQMPDYGVIFSDGIESDYLVFNSGTIARIGLAERKAHLIMAN